MRLGFVLALYAPLLACSVSNTALDVYNEPPETQLGCECKAPAKCQTSILFKCNVMSFCEVKDKNCKYGTAPYSASHGYYDWCKFVKYSPYEDLTAKEKKAIILKHVHDDQSHGSYPSTLGVLTGIMGESVMTSFNASADVFPESGRIKYIHSVGVVGGIKYTSVQTETSNPIYTGLFQGADHGIIRFSSAKKPAQGGGVAPGMGVKFFRDGQPSANFVAMYSLDGQPCESKDFFQNAWHNHIWNTDNYGLKLIAAKFWQASYCPLMVGLSDLATTQSGPTVFPYKLKFKANIRVNCDCADYESCLKNLADIPVGTVLFNVSAQAEPGWLPGMETYVYVPYIDIGYITVTDKFTTSKFGDEQLFFRHQHMEEDFALRPEWLDQLDRESACGMACADKRVPEISQGCSSPFGSSMLTSDYVV